MESVDLTTGLVLVCSFLLSLFCLRTWTGRRGRPDKFPPSPPGLPFLGNLLSLTREPHLQLTAWRRQYGDVFSLRMGPQDVVVVNGCAAIKEALVMKAAHFSDRPSLLLTDVCDCKEGLIMAKYGNKWKSFRRFGLSALRHLGVGKEKLESIIRHECMVLVKCFEDKDGRPFQVSRIIQIAVCNVIASIVLGRRFEPDDPDFKDEIERVDRTFQLFLDAQPLNFYPALRHVPGFRGMFREWMEIDRKSGQWYGKFIEEHKETFDPSNIRDLIDVCLLEIEQKNGSETFVTEVTIRHIASEFFDAGTETTTTTLCWALLYLALNPSWQRKVQEELDTVVGRDEIPPYSRREELPFTEATILESQRIRTTVPLSVPHCTSSPTGLQGYDIPAHTQVWVNLWSVHMDPAYWSHPDTFDPSRFLDDNGRVKVPEAFMPFSTGRRICLGEQLAKMELFLFLTSLLQQFTFKLPEGAPEPDMAGEIGATLLPRPYKIQAVYRKK
ncbi:cytochrome P450 2U1-like [Branchiostoma lanceolatum]|uniref:cytochrome P450 2U1-like n=1 Tax=Branchiostoma lanceolatum TaxID=7740 RepID=UPI00345203D2